MNNKNDTTPKNQLGKTPPPYLPSRLSRIILEAAAQDYQHPEVQAAYKEWKKENRTNERS